MATNWDELDAQYKSNFKEYAPEGDHKTKVKEVEFVESSKKGTPGLRFTFEDNDDYAFPKFGCTHWVSFNNEGWRKHHFKELMKVLGASEDNARKAVDVCESKGDNDKIVKAYVDAFTRLVSKHPAVDVVVYRRTPTSEYADVDFASRDVRMGHPDKKEDKAPTVAEEEMIAESEEIDISDIPF